MIDKASTRYVALMTTHRCNLQCTYCYEKFKSSKTLSAKPAKQYLQKCFSECASSNIGYKMIEISFMGGEPLLEFQLIQEICEWVWKQNWPIPYYFFASTNGTLLTPEKKGWFEKNKEKFVLGLSIDGTMQMQMLNRGELSTRIDTGFFVDTWPSQNVKCTISMESLSSLAEGIIHLHEQGFSQISANLAFGIDWKISHLKEYKNQLLKLVDYYKSHPQINRCSLLDMDLNSILDFTRSYEKFCGCGVSTTLFDGDGKEYPCPVFSPITLSKERLDSLSTIDFYDTDSFISKECKKCVLHRSCPKCYGMNFVQTGNPAIQNAFYCKAYKIQLLANCILTEYLLCQGFITGELAERNRNVLRILQYIL